MRGSLLLLSVVACVGQVPVGGGGPGSIDARASGDGPRTIDARIIDADPAAPDAAMSQPDAAPEPTGGYFVAVGYGGRRARTTDHGQSWDVDISDVANGGDDSYLMRDINWGGGQWIGAPGINGNKRYSPDAVNWTSRPAGQWYGGLGYANGIWVAVGGYGTRDVSTDGGVTWQNTSDSAGNPGYRGLGVGLYNGAPRWVGVGDNGAVSVYDGTTWSRRTVGFTNYEAAFGNNIIVIMGDYGSSNVARSTDGGVTWIEGTLPGNGSGLTFGQGKFVAVGNGRVMTSTDGATWDSRSVPGISGFVAFGDGVFLAVEGRTFVSTDAITWTEGAGLGSQNDIMSVRYGGY